MQANAARADEVGHELATHFQTFRSRLADRVYWAAGVLAVLYLPMLWWRIQDVGFHRQLQFHAALIGITMVALLFLRRMPLRLKSGVLVVFFLALGLSGVFTMGMVGTGYWWCLQAAVLAATLISMRAGIALALVCAALMFVSGTGFVTGMLSTPFDLNAHATNASAWAAFLVVVLFAPLALLLALGGYQSMIEKLVAELHAQRQLLVRQVGHDPLTDLPLMRLASDRLDAALTQARRAGDKVALLFVDLDGFKAVNDTHGHLAGDHLLRTLATRLQALVREGDTVARVGGDEFILILAGLGTREVASRLADAIVAGISAPVDWQGGALRVGASVGIALYPDHAADGEALRRLADSAMYGVKKAGKNGWRFTADAVGVPQL